MFSPLAPKYTARTSRVGRWWPWSLLASGLCACGARTELDNTGYTDGAGHGTGTVNPLNTLPVPPSSTAPPVATPPTTAPPSIPPSPMPPSVTTPPTTTPGMTDVDPFPPPPDGAPGPCTDADAPNGRLRVVVPPPLLRTPLPPSICGDQFVGYSEQCDDGNVADGDGCDSSCSSEPYFDCPREGGACTRVHVCGDGVLGSSESCDDGNPNGGDGCSANCQIEQDSLCVPAGALCTQPRTCGDSLFTFPEQCEPPGRPGCTLECTVLPGWVCPPDAPCFTRCGDGILAGQEQCEDGNTAAADGCGPSCEIEWVACLASGDCGQFGIGLCGNGVLELGEACDDGGATTTCSALCQLEPQCDASGNCAPLCGDGLVTSEDCDDGNQRPDDGCSATCTVEAGYACTLHDREAPITQEPPPPSSDVDGGASGGAPPPLLVPLISRCAPWCGDGVQQRGEQCDPISLVNNPDNPICDLACRFGQPFCGDGVVNGYETCDDGVNDGISAQGCPPGCSVAKFCGDGVVQPETEDCDLGKENNRGGYGNCTSNCRLAARCGDGIVQACGEEECDDGNRHNGDGCSVVCKQERAVR